MIKIIKIEAGTPEAEKVVKHLKKCINNTLELQKTNVLTEEGQRIVRYKANKTNTDVNCFKEVKKQTFDPNEKGL